MRIAYLACPYAHPDPKIKEKRLTLVTQVACELFKQGIFVYSPLTHNIPINRLGIHGNWAQWRDFDCNMLSRCDYLIVLKLPGWEESRGVTAEIAKAKELDLPIELLDPPAYLLNSESAQVCLQELSESIQALFSERDWDQFHSPKNIAMSLSIESNELLEHFLWLSDTQSYIEDPQKLNKIRDEIGDVVINIIRLAERLGIDPLQAAQHKLKKIVDKYPVNKCKGSINKYTEF